MRPRVTSVFWAGSAVGLAFLVSACQMTGADRQEEASDWLAPYALGRPSGDAVARDPALLPDEGTPATRTVQPYRSNGAALHGAANRPATSWAGRGVELAFEDTPIVEVVSVVVGDMLGAGFVIDPGVDGRVTLRTAGAVEEADLPGVLAQALAVSGYSLSQSADGTFLVTAEGQGDNILGRPRLPGDGLPVGQGILVIPLSYIDAQAMAQVLQPFARSGAQIVPDLERSVLVLAAEAALLESMLEMVELFDVDWLAGKAVALYPLQSARPDTIVSELYAVLGGREGAGSEQLEFVALDRLNAIVVLASTPDRLNTVEAWVERLDVQPASSRELRVRTLTNADAQTVASHLSEFFSSTGEQQRVLVRADEASNSLLVSATAADHAEVEAFVRQIDRAPDQVLIEALIVEVVLTDDLQYGVQWFLDTRDGGSGVFSTANTGAVASRFPGFSYTYDSDFVRAALNAISSLTEVETLSTPQIVLRNNTSATMRVGDQVPVITQSAVSVADPDAPIVNSIQFRDTGVALEVRARIDPAGLIVLDVVQEVSSVAETTTSGIDSPTIQQRRLESSVSLYDGESVVLGGLIRSQQTQSRSGVPGLQRIPGLGAAFSDTSNRARRTELLVFLTPRILRTRDDAIAVSQALRDRMEVLRMRRMQTNAN